MVRHFFHNYHTNLGIKMAYAVMTTWKHNNPIDWKEMASVDFSMMPKGTTVQWFAIDEYKHGSFATFYLQRSLRWL